MARTPRPGRAVRGSRTGRPIMALMDLLGRRWALRVVWELREGRLTFRALQEACGGVSPTVLNERLGELRESGLLDSVGTKMRLGRSLLRMTSRVTMHSLSPGNDRFLSLHEGQVTFRWKDRAHGNALRVAALEAEAFCFLAIKPQPAC